MKLLFFYFGMITFVAENNTTLKIKNGKDR